MINNINKIKMVNKTDKKEQDTTLIRVSLKNKARLESYGLFGESMDVVVERVLGFAEFGKQQDKSQTICKEIENKLSQDKVNKKRSIKTPEHILKNGKY
jgi:hypothetical protein